MQVISPATGHVIGSWEMTPLCAVDGLYDNARTSFATWSKLSHAQRLLHLKRLREVIVRQQEEIAQVIHESTGKNPVEAVATEVIVVLEAILHLEKRLHAALRTRKVKTPIAFIGKSSYVEYKPRGVVLVISPWNFPFQLTMIPVIEALAVGNTVISKPSEATPMVGLLMERLFQSAGFPHHAIQFAHGDKALGEALVNARPDYIHFTGSVASGKRIQADAAKELIPTTLELGGKDPMIVFADANLDRAVQGALWGGFSNSGQVCMSVERVYVESSVYDKFVQKLAAAVEMLKQGAGLDDDVGAMTLPRQIDVVKQHLEDALAKGATLVRGTPPQALDSTSMFVAPIVLTGVNHTMDVMREETFGPILPIVLFETEADAIRLANDSQFGLSASVWTADLQRGKRVVSQLLAGNVVINDVLITIANPYLPYGGVKASGIGAYHSDMGLQNFCIRTSVMVDKGRKLAEVNWFPYRGKFALFASLIRSYYGRRRHWVRFLTSYLQLSKRTRIKK